MGVFAVNATLNVGSISRAVIAAQLAEQDSPRVELWVRGRDALRLETLQFLKQRLQNVKAISGQQWLGPAITIFADQQAEPRLHAIAPDYLRVLGRQVIAGRLFNPEDFTDYRAVTVIDQRLAEELLLTKQDIGERLYISQRPYVLVGIISPFPGEDDSGGRAYIPLTYAYALFGNRAMDNVALQPHDWQDTVKLSEQAQALVENALPNVRRVGAWSNVEEILIQQSTLSFTSNALAAVGAIALLIGGIGIANIMIASVVERTPEIGLRRAIGATQADVMLQILLEAVILSVLGGAAAIAAVHSATTFVAERFELPYEIDQQVVLLSFGSAVAVGVGAGFLPALRASRLDPVSALRAE